MRAFLALLLLGALPACQPSLNRQPKNTALGESGFFADGAAARPLPGGVVPFHAGAAPEPPFPAVLERGRSRYDIYCTACHGYTGEAGIAGLRGFGEIPSLLGDRARRLSDDEAFRIVRNGRGGMAGLGDRLPESDIRAVVHYLRALQLSQGVRLRELPARDRARFAGGGP